jgi:hypothetical protein
VNQRTFSPAFIVFTSILVLTVARVSTCGAAISSFTDYLTYRGYAGPQSLIGFSEVPLGTTLSGQYSGLGLRFLDGDDRTVSDSVAYPKDTFGLEGGPREGDVSFITLQFAQPVRSLGVDFPGALRVELFNGLNSLGSSANFGSSGTGFFGGVISDIPFDRAVLSDWFAGDVYIDNLHVTPVPEPSMLALLAVASLGICWRAWRKPHFFKGSTTL